MVEDRRGVADGSAVPTISELIERQRRASGLSYREMAERAERAGLRIKFQTIANLATAAPKEWPKKTETIRALAEGLDVPERLVVLSFARSFGLDVQRDESTLGLMLPTGTRHLDEGVQGAVAALVRSIIESRKDVGDDGRSATTNHAEVSSAESASAGPSGMPGQHNVTQLPTAEALDPTIPDDVAARSEQGKGKSQEARERQDEESGQ